MTLLKCRNFIWQVFGDYLKSLYHPITKLAMSSLANLSRKIAVKAYVNVIAIQIQVSSSTGKYNFSQPLNSSQVAQC